MKNLMKKMAVIMATTTMMFALEVPTDHLVSTDWLAKHINDENLVIIDTREAKDYNKGHIEGAVNYPKEIYFQGKLGTVMELPSTPAQMQEMLQNAGVTDESAIVFYSGGKNSVDFADAASGLWNSWIYGLQNVALLNGGYAKWIYEKRSTTTKLPTITKGDIELETYDKSAVASINDIFEAIYDEDKQIADARVGKFYRGEDTREDLARHGRIPTAKLTPMIRYVKDSGKYFAFLDKNETKQILYNNGFGVELDKPLNLYCNSGHKTRGLWFVAKFLAEMKDVKVYDGGIIEYSRSNMPMETGEPMD
ncbi:sulfurtransferase [Sulfurovum sp. TSL1]|uniref:sulfurtransferase n=1 Tax=Sulfurovum sp. TSL1 TaxID=2826994 RepID=UPI001CC4614C|nr:rhodanese-like domain-containing protein [Sulfurovum sp. TSL1]GIT99080.1 sulfurtransferase [Sulfurovum sp. TSL1]